MEIAPLGWGMLLRSAIALGLVITLGCGDDAPACATPRDCEFGRICVNGACTLPAVDSGQDAPGDASDAADAADVGVDAPPICPEGAECVPVPEGWSAPGILVRGAPGEAACTGRFSEPLTTVFRGARGEAATCTDCECGNPTLTECAVPVSIEEHSGFLSCSMLLRDPLVDECSESNPIATAYRGRTGSGATGTCDVVAESVATATEPTWDEELVLCAGARETLGECAPGERCALTPDSGPQCIVGPGDVACPSGFGRRLLAYSSVADDRGCRECSCGFTAAGCDATITAYSGSGCGGGVLSRRNASETGCYRTMADSFAISDPVPIAPQCVSPSSQATGCAVGGDPVTVCCQPEASEETCPTEGTPMVEIPTGDGEFFCMDSTEVTQAQYAAFVASGPSVEGQPPECADNTEFDTDPVSDTPDAPVGNVDWCDARAYCESVGKHLCGPRAGTTIDDRDEDSLDNQWFYACSEGGTRIRPDSGGPECDRGILSREPLAPVRSNPCCQGPLPGLFGLGGQNAQEWIDACSEGDRNAECLVMGGRRIFAGGECDASDTERRTTRNPRIGFRCCAR